MRAITFITIFVAISGVAQAAEPLQPEAQADELMRQGLELRRQGKNAQALELLQKAQAMAPSARSLAQVGSAEFALQRWMDAETHLQQALALHDSPWIDNQRNREMLERTLTDARRHVARLDLRGTPGAQVSIDGKPAGALPLSGPVYLAAATVRITATAPGRQGFEKAITVGEGQETLVDIDLVTLPVLTPQPPSPFSTVVSQPTRAADGAGGSTWRRWTGGTLFVAGLAAVGAGVAWVVLDGRTSCNPPPGGACELVYNTKTQGWISIGAGAVVAAAGATLFFWRGKEASGGLAIGPGVLTLHGRF